MYPVLILREEAVCLVILLFLTLMARKYHLGKDSLTFHHLIRFATIHTVFDVITVWTVNHTDRVPAWLNTVCHLIFYFSAIFFSYEILLYVIKLFRTGKPAKARIFFLIPVALYACALPFLEIKYEQVNGTWSSAGSAAVAGYGIAFLYFLLALFLIFTHWNQMTSTLKYSLLPMMLLLILAEAAQMVWKELLFTGAAITIVSVGFFFALENPAAALERKAQIDAMTGVLSRNRYEEDITKLEEDFLKDRTKPYIFVFADLNNLKSVNGLYGHAVGDEYISKVAVALLNGMKNAIGIYRMGGDEFLAIYRGTDEKTVKKDIVRAREICAEKNGDIPYTPVVAFGYAVSDAQYKSLRDVLRVADFMMFSNKADLKRDNAMSHMGLGTALNLTGLTDRVFDALSCSSERYYPFLTNMETGVTRIATGWNEEYDLGGEFFADFGQVWIERIHPDDREEYIHDVSAAMEGTKQYHYCRYRALNKEGKYITCSCRGGLYRGKDGEPDIFAGYLVSLGKNETTDSITGLPGYNVITGVISDYMSKHMPFSAIRLANGNLEQIRAVYGYITGTTAAKRFADILTQELGLDGKAYSDAGTDFTVLLRTTDQDELRNIFNRIRSRCEAGINTGSALVPIRLIGAAVCYTGNEFPDSYNMRVALIYTLKEAKEMNASELMFYQPSGSENNDGKLDLLSMVFRDAVDHRERFYLRYQPLIDNAGNAVAAEALLRWQSPDNTEVEPGRFIQQLETDPAYIRLSWDILRWALRMGKQMITKRPDFCVSVNITAIQIQERGFSGKVLKILQEEDYPPQNLILELTERCKELNIELLQRKVDLLRGKGVRVALDDMGTGYSTLDLLMSLPVDEIKLDRNFVTDLPGNPNRIIYTKALCESVRNTRTQICFEGVEDEQTLSFVRNFGDVLVQGYYYDKPLLPEDFIKKYRI